MLCRFVMVVVAANDRHDAKKNIDEKKGEEKTIDLMRLAIKKTGITPKVAH